ncbi:uncharacterized protein YybS (DUF2232 family) [Paenibacillus methanolicus]|uniref:Uncharacterized protein YybS (DUF2232 family) n=2 Tax=Paenibacillus methanolicus TaxID=582686 RepID=A0A5S5CAJ5_9BACL|nr:uncharacterized protein YybS (DUF2232 family) [Paenibacillus methanolicus]
MKSLLWSALLLALLLAVAVPLLNALALAVMLVPAVLLYATLSKPMFAVHMGAVYGIALAIMGPPALIVGLFFVVPAIVMGHLYRKGAPARKVVTATLLTLLAELMLELVLLDRLFDMSLLTEIRDLILQATGDLDAQGLLPATWGADMTDAFIQTMIHSIPMTMITVAFLYAVITHAIARPLLRASGIEVPGLQKAREWMLPRLMVFYYLIVLFADMVVPDQGDSFLTVALLNLVPLMRLAFTIQAIGFFFYVAHQRGWSRVVPILLGALVVAFPPLSLIGVFDAAFPIRAAFKKP